MTERLDRIEAILQQLAEQQQSSQVKLDAAIESLDAATQQLGAVSEGLTRLENLSERILLAIDRQTDSINAHLQLAQQQAANISELSKLVAAQAATVDFLVRRGT